MAKARGSLKQKRGKNKKKSWKQIQHEDVDNFLDDVRADERHGIRSKPDDELFQIDHLGFSLTEQDFTDNAKTEPAQPTRLTRSKTGPLVRIEDLKCFTLLKPHTSVPDPVVKRNPLTKKGVRKSARMAAKDEARQSKKEAAVIKEAEICEDPWGTEEKKTLLDTEWIDPSIKRANLPPRIRKPKQNVTSELPAVELPHAGFSYNPSFQDHQQLLKTAVNTAALSSKREQRLNKSIAPTTCLSIQKEESESEDEPEQLVEEVTSNLVAKSKAKTKQQKRKEREEKEKLRRQKDKKKANTRQNEVYRLKTIQKSIIKTEKKQKERLAKTVEKKIAREKFGQKKISKHQYEELPLDPAFSDEIQGNLVGITAHNRLTLERFNSLQKRNIVEPRVKQRQHRKLRRKKFQKSVDKMDWEKTGFWNGIKVVH